MTAMEDTVSNCNLCFDIKKTHLSIGLDRLSDSIFLSQKFDIRRARLDEHWPDTDYFQT